MRTKDISHMPDDWQAAYREGAKDFAIEQREMVLRWRKHHRVAEGRVEPEIAARYMLARNELLQKLYRGEWPEVSE